MTKELINLYKAGTVFLAILSILAVVYAYSEWKSMKYMGLAPQNTISVSGEGKVKAVPDTSVISITSRETGKTTKEAQDKVAKKMAEVKAKLKALGVEDKDVKTTSFTTYPKYTYNPTTGKQTLDGYEVAQTDEVKVRNIDNVGKVLEAVAAAGINEVSGPSLTVDQPEKLKEEAREKAIAEAKAKAEKLADQLGVELVRIVSFSEGGDNVYMPYMKAMSTRSDMMMGAAPEISVSAGEQDIISNVTITFEIK